MITKLKAAGRESTAASKPHFASNLTPSPWCGKAYAMFLYAVGARTLEETQAAFDANPRWWRA